MVQTTRKVEDIFYSQDSIMDRVWSDEDCPGLSVFEMVCQLLTGERNVNEIDKMQVFTRESVMYSLNNSRLFVLKKYDDICKSLVTAWKPLSLSLIHI